jgi:A/G-specific adenine glycosylase
MIDFDSNWFSRFRRNLRRWYERNARNLPWRNTSNPYRIWISEIMLQQTTVVAVVPYYQKFLKRFPTVRKLAEASEDEVLRYWEGLGYYSRARNIHKTAKLLVEQYQGRFPQDVTELQNLPGIGRYTAGAIASFAFDQPAPIVEANTLRLYSRLMGLEQDPRSGAGQRLLWNFAERVLPRKTPGRFNQALIELGATLCTAREPNCPNCPVKSSCRAFADGTQHEIPRPMQRPEITRITEAAVVVQQNNLFLLRRCESGERWAGLWDFPRFPLENGVASKSKSPRNFLDGMKSQLDSHLQKSLGITADVSELLTELTHSVTRYRIRLFCFVARIESPLPAENHDRHWVRCADFENYPLSVTGRKIANLLKELDI